jgi:hypothetical protein
MPPWNMVEMNLKNSIMVIFVKYDHPDGYREDQGCHWCSGS